MLDEGLNELFRDSAYRSIDDLSICGRQSPESLDGLHRVYQSIFLLGFQSTLRMYFFDAGNTCLQVPLLSHWVPFLPVLAECRSRRAPSWSGLEPEDSAIVCRTIRVTRAEARRLYARRHRSSDGITFPEELGRGALFCGGIVKEHLLSRVTGDPGRL